MKSTKKETGTCVPIISRHVWGGRRLGYRGLEMLEVLREAWDDLHEELEQLVDHRRLEDGAEVGCLEIGPDGEIVDWTLEEQYARGGA